MIRESDAAYMAGLFDGEGSIYYKKLFQKSYKGRKTGHWRWNIRMEISMTDRSVIEWFGDVLKVGQVKEKKVNNNGIKGVRKRQWRWRCGFRDAYYVCRVLWPYAHTKLPKIQQVIDHYSKEKIMNNNVVSLEEYKKAMSLE
jgi:hypothetical protein